VKLKVKHCAGSDKNSRQTTTPVFTAAFATAALSTALQTR